MKASEKEEAQKLYNLQLHNSIEINTHGVTYHITRVIGGWLYNHIRLDSDAMTSVFVPFNNEYMNLRRKQNEQSK